MNNEQEQKGGSGSTNIQASGDVIFNSGINFADARQLFLDLFQENFTKLSQEAGKIARGRAEEITEDFLAKLQERHAEGLETVRDPDFQHSLFTVQKEYARSGNKDLGDLLVDILVERTRAEPSSLTQIVLNESLATVPKLTLPQIRALAVTFLMRHAVPRKAASGIDEYEYMEYLEGVVVPIAFSLPKRDAADYRHLEYSRCAKTPYMFIDFDKMIWDLISTASTSFRKDDFMMQVEKIPNMKYLAEKWNHTQLGTMYLTTVGLAIAHAFMHSRTGLFGDLSVWLD